MPGEMSIGQDERGHLQYTALVPVSEWVVEGSLIRRTAGSVVIVHKVNRKNYLCYDEKGQGWNIPIQDQKPLDKDTQFDRTAYDAMLRRESEKRRAALDAAISSDLEMGQAVKFMAVTMKRKYPGVYIVCSAPNASGKVRLAKLGGENGRYFPGVAVGQVERVTLDWTEKTD